MINIVTASPTHTGIGKYAYDLFQTIRSNYQAKLLVLESKGFQWDKDRRGVESIPKKWSIPRYSQIWDHLLNFPNSCGQRDGVVHYTAQYFGSCLPYQDNAVITHHDLAPWILPDEYTLANKFFWKRFMSHYRSARGIIVHTAQAGEELVKFGLADEDKIHLNHLGVNDSVYYPRDKQKMRQKHGLDPDAKLVLYVGTQHSRRKNFPFLMEVLTEIKKKMPDMKLVTLGGLHPDLTEKREYLETKSFQFVLEEDMPEIYSACDFFVLPSLYEGGFAYPPVEAMMCGVPGIVSEDMRIYDKVCPILSPTDKQAWISKISDYLNDDELEEAREKSLAFAATQTLKLSAENTVEIYQKCGFDL